MNRLEGQLATAYVNALDSIERGVPVLQAGKANWDQMQALCTWFRQRAACALLLSDGVDEDDEVDDDDFQGEPLNVDANEFYLAMMQSAAAFLHFLPTCPAEQQVASQCKPFFDALCGGYVDAARTIAKASRRTWNRDREKQADFFYVQLLMGLICADDDAAITELHTQLVAASQGKEPLRLAICAALVARDEQAFNEGIAAQLAARVGLVQDLIARTLMPTDFAVWIQRFASEGLALVRIAETLNIATPGPHLHISQTVRALAPFPFDTAAWRPSTKPRRPSR